MQNRAAQSKRTLIVGFSALALLLGGTVLMELRPPAVNAPAFAVSPGLDAAEKGGALEGVASATSTTTLVSATTIEAPPITPVNALLVGDSVLAELRWFEQGVLSLQGFTYTLDGESCRRLAFESCEGREMRIPQSATKVVEDFVGPVDVVVLVGGYHASVDSIRQELQTFAAAVAAKGARLVILTFKESLAFPAAGSNGTESVYTEFNGIVRSMAAEGVLGDATIADWNSFSYGGGAWFRSDGLHTNLVGTLALGWFISATVAALFNNPCPVYGTYPCAPPEIADSNIDWIAAYGATFTDWHCYQDGAQRERVCGNDRNM